MTKGTGREVKESEFKKIKQLLDLGLNFPQISQIAKRSTTVISYVKRSEDFADYKKLSAERYTKKEVPTVAVSSVATKTTVKPATFNTQDSYLYRIANALERIADASEKKRGWKI